MSVVVGPLPCGMDLLSSLFLIVSPLRVHPPFRRELRAQVAYRGAPLLAVALRVAPGPPAGAACTARGRGVEEATAGAAATFAVTARDAFGNAHDAGGFVFTVRIQGHDSGPVRGACADTGAGEYACSYLTTRALAASLAVTTAQVGCHAHLRAAAPTRASPFCAQHQRA